MLKDDNGRVLAKTSLNLKKPRLILEEARQL